MLNASGQEVRPPGIVLFVPATHGFGAPFDSFEYATRIDSTPPRDSDASRYSIDVAPVDDLPWARVTIDLLQYLLISTFQKQNSIESTGPGIAGSIYLVYKIRIKKFATCCWMSHW